MFSSRFISLFCGSLILLSATFAVAQEHYPAPAQTPEAAGAGFYQFLEAGAVTPNSTAPGAPFDTLGAEKYSGALSRAQLKALSATRSDKIDRLFALLVRQSSQAPQFEGRTASRESGKTLVEVTRAPAVLRQVVVVPEDGGYRVDIKATFGLWNDLSGQALDLFWLEATGIVSPALAASPEFQRTREIARRESCQSNMKQQMLGVFQYIQDHEGQFPSARVWIDATFPYLKSDYVYRCPEFPTTKGDIAYGYAFNQYISQQKQGKLASPARTVVIYEASNPARNWFGPGTGRAYRHGDGSNIAFADGHVKWYPRGDEPDVKFKP